MRYTTIIDITEQPAVYRNINVRLLYLHLCLKCGYHDHDRDIYDRSLRSMAVDCGLTLSAVRHALHILEQAQLVSKVGGVWQVRKYIQTAAPTPRPKTKRQQAERDISQEREQANQERERQADIERQRREQQHAAGTNDFIVYYEQKMREAAEGDIDAQRAVDRHRAYYEQLKSKFKSK